ncbi:hypothetical protein [Natrinema sp. DC36]|uniref:hypothetical protein n=1 Tax=Natrinema sp. DC36 TaxID=2878680 RepID=UPI001CF0C5D9|nr:hypothetical protein [Natrinema sp. DC36]
MVVSLEVFKHLVKGLRQQPVIDVQSFLINKGRAWTVSSRFSNVGTDDSIYVHTDNPDGSGYDYDVVFLPRSSGDMDIDISFGGDANDATAVTANNLKSGTERAFSGTVSEFNPGSTGTAPSHGTTFIEDHVPGGSQGSAIASQVIDAVAWTVDEGDDKLIEITATDWSGTLAINLIIFEIDGTYKEV